MYQIKSGVHGPTDISPVGLAAALHLGIAIPNFGIQEYMKHSPATDEVFQPDVHASPTAGWTRARRPASACPIWTKSPTPTRTSPAYLPVNRLLDGSMHDW